MGAHETSKEVVLGEKNPSGLAHSPICFGRFGSGSCRWASQELARYCPQQVLKGVEGEDWPFH